MSTEDEKREENEKYKNEICYFVENIMHHNLSAFEKILLQKMVDARQTNTELVFIPSRLSHRHFLQDTANSNKIGKSKNIKTRIKLKPDKPEYWTVIDDTSLLRGSLDPEYK